MENNLHTFDRRVALTDSFSGQSIVVLLWIAATSDACIDEVNMLIESMPRVITSIDRVAESEIPSRSSCATP